MLRYLQRRRPKYSISRPVARYIENLRRSTKRRSSVTRREKRDDDTEVKSFGAFLGSFAQPPTAAQQRLLSQWDILVVDPTQMGVVPALASCQPTSAHVLARLDLDALMALHSGGETAADGDDGLACLTVFTSAIETHVQHAAVQGASFTGVLLAGFASHLHPAIVNDLARYLKDLGFDLWLELSYPDYLDEDYAPMINLHLLKGLVYRNGTMRPDGDRQNYFQMTAMRAVMRAMAAQRVSHNPALVMWEVVDDGMELHHAVITRTFNWCLYYCAVNWIGHKRSLTDAEFAATDAIPTKPLGALMWLKNDKNMSAHNVWRGNDQMLSQQADNAAVYDSISSFLPNIASRLHLQPAPAQASQQLQINPTTTMTRSSTSKSLALLAPPGMASGGEHAPVVNPLGVSCKGDDFTGLGCFQLGHETSFQDFAAIRRSQQNLQDLSLLAVITGEELYKARTTIEVLRGAKELSPAASDAVKDLLDLLSEASTSDAADSPNPRLKVFSGLQSGFHVESGAVYYGMYDYERADQCLILYLSNKATDRAGAILHTYLSSRQITRTECFMVEQLMADRNGQLKMPWKLAPRLVQDLETLSPQEALLFMKRLALSRESSALLALIRPCLEAQLVDAPSLTQLRVLCSTGYLSGHVTAEEMIAARLAWLADKGCDIPDAYEANKLFHDVYDRLYDVLMGIESEVLAQLGEGIQKIVLSEYLDAGADIFLLAVFSAFRRMALDEVYLEVLDRNVYPNHSADQAGCFAENFGLGSRCDSFFDTTPRSIGRILSDRYRAYYTEFQPPLREEGFTELPTAYFAMQVDFDPEDGKTKIPFYYRITFFGIFALPALVDVMLLTTIGRGLYLTTYMSSEQKTMATTALMLSLLMSGSFGAWICSGGSYYFFSNAFPAMNYFIMTRFVAGIAVTSVTAIIGFIVVIFVHGISNALVFLFYFVMLSTYMLALNALSIYQQPGSEFLSGRTTIITCIPILFISPVVSIFTRHDIAVYIPVLTVFCLSLLYGARKTLAEWSSWYLHIPPVTDSEVVAWFRGNSKGSTTVDLENMRDNDVMPLARDAIHKAVVKETKRWFFVRSSADPLVKKLAEGYGATMYLMQWYSKYKRSRMPMPYSTTWNLTLKAGLENITNMQKGLKMHSAFLHWRSTGKDILSGFMYFVIALLDKWIALMTRSHLVGLSAASSTLYRFGIGFGLCYYLFGAVALDIVSQPMWIAANEKSKQPITSLESLSEITKNDIKARHRLYWRSLVKFFFFHLWGTAIFSALIWAYDDDSGNCIMFLSYILAYSGLLWFQYNKIFCGTNGANALICGFFVGLPVGLAVRLASPGFGYSGVICLGSATWASCIASFWTADIGMPTIDSIFGSKAKSYAAIKFSGDGENVPVYTLCTIEPIPELSQSTIGKMFEDVKERFPLESSQHPGQRVLELLVPQDSARLPTALNAAFPSAYELMHLASQSWKNGRIMVELISGSQLPLSEAKTLHLARRTSDKVIHLFVVTGTDVFNEQTLNVHEQWGAIAEAIVQTAAEHIMGLSHRDATLASLLAVNHFSDAEISVPEGMKLQLKASSTERLRVIRAADQVQLTYALLGVDCEREWDGLPKSVRSFLTKRSVGAQVELTEADTIWLQERIGSSAPVAVDEHLARCRVGAAMTKALVACAAELERTDCGGSDNEHEGLVFSASTAAVAAERLNAILPMTTSLVQKFNLSFKFLILSLTADPEYQRELNYVTQGLPAFIRGPVTFFLNGIWVYCKMLQALIIPFVLFHGRDHIDKIKRLISGMTTVLEKNRIVTENFSGPSTWFWTSSEEDGASVLRLSQYSGLHNEEPQSTKDLKAINTYTDKLVLQQRQLYAKGKVVDSFRYEYEQSSSRLPMQRTCVEGKKEGEIVNYDRRGYITTGSEMRGVNRVTWKLWYRKSAKHEDELLWAEYTFPHITIKVLWSMPPRNPNKRLEEWIPFSTVTEATFIQGEQVYHASWDYEHKFHPEVAVMLNGKPVETPLMIKEDWFHVFDKPDSCSFLSENPLLSFSSIKSNPIARFFRFNVKRYQIPTSVARTQLWKVWKNSRDVDAISVRWLDEKLLRSDRIMRRYWRLRDFGRLDAATAYVDAQVDTIMARVDIDPQTSAWTNLAFKLSDFYAFGQAGDARINTRKADSQLWGSEHELHVLAMDTSTWPNDPGGVSACRRDMVNDLRTIKWHVVAESANDFGVPRFQIERNVQSLTILPLWGLDFLNPTHGIIETCLDSSVVQRSFNTRAADIVDNFLPILTSLVTCSRAIDLNRQHIEEATAALVALNAYFERSRNWNDVWYHPVVKQRWRELWLTEMPNTLSISQWWDFERPSIKQLDEALNLWCRYLFIFSLPVPEQIPDVFQASHHFTGATYGIVCKVKRNCSLHIWDHCISFREFTSFMSSAVSFDSPFVNSSLISLTHLSCVLLEHHADVVLPCCDYFNPGWEVELGTAEGALEHRNTFARKIDPVVNGICNMEKFEPIKTIRTETPTVVMLSHLQYAKDIKNAIMATDIIVNRWGFKDYKVHVYGDMERAAAIATECQELIASKNLQDVCVLKGLGNPSLVLQDAWLFLNSSISEGLPLAMGEAALTGVPVVCTDVGASYCVVTDRTTGDRFSEVVPPNDSESLARAQISVMALLGPWASYGEDEPGVEVPVLGYPLPTAEQVQQISDRMYAKQDQRRALGMLGRQNVLKNFSSDRYLREHEQMLWIGKQTSPSNIARTATAGTPASVRSSFMRSQNGGTRSRPVSRLTPESWISLSSEETAKGWRSLGPSSVSVRDFFKEK
ncbi:glycosyl group 1 family protein [Grosmannia clavigera kw1407]|uniref:Glycosyl group 1 family protein n=1 Tax=Grosmannia clavigera (strain kw1407 / UAMH 11150) TaxID=655863 RepID=F0XBL0_GROCL|nr:glycosyl group 1 family protein [Grosmannia clavigera kw1407]EFX04881.1 glycosyl group 1 family protein [Grosmannia clavigera kw1407]